MEAIGYDLSNCLPSVQATTASGVVSVAPLMLMNLAALGHVASGFEVIVHALPPTSKVDGLLGLDFFRNRVLTLNFQKGEIALTP